MPRPKPTHPCSVPGCHRQPVGRGLCMAHYQQWKRHPEREPEPLREQPARALVSVSIRVSEHCAGLVRHDRAGAREALERWAREKPGGQCRRDAACCKPNRHAGACFKPRK